MLAVAPCDEEEPVSSTVCRHSIADGGIVPPVTLFDVMPLRLTVCFLGAKVLWKRLFKKGFGLDDREILSV